MPKFLDYDGLQVYNNNVIKALNEKANKIHVGITASTKLDSNDVWFDVTDDTEPVSVMSLSYDEDEVLTFNEDTAEELTFNNEDTEEELTFNEEDSTEEELTFNEEDSIEEELTFNDE